MSGILILYHCESNTGYAIQTLEDRFLQAARRHYRDDDIHLAYPEISRGMSDAIPADFRNVVKFDPNTRDKNQISQFAEYIAQHQIEIIFGFDQPVRQAYYKSVRQAGVRAIISYYGASISSLNSGLKLLLKKIDVALSRHAPDHYIFESQGMLETATHGRGITKNKTSIVYLGVDTERFQPDANNRYAYDLFDIPDNRKIVFFSGHMEPRKGVAVIMDAANLLVNEQHNEDVHFLILGNQPGQEHPFLHQLTGNTPAHVTFGGYRNDIHKILPGCYLGCIASVLWDSFTMSSTEMAACGLPLIVSNLPGLSETVEDGSTGLRFRSGDANELAGHIDTMIADPIRHKAMSDASRQRVLQHFTRDIQIDQLANIIARFRPA